MMLKTAKIFLGLVVVLVIQGCASFPRLEQAENKSPATPVQGDWISVERIKDYSLLTLRFMFWLQGINESMPVSHGIHLYRVVYWTKNPEGQLTQASGLLGLPKTRPPYKSVISWQHGTESLRDNAPSNLSLFHGMLPAAVFAGHGSVLLAPDYIGYGISTEPHSYYHRKSTADSVIDFIAAARTLITGQSILWPERLFLTGFSQGGYASLAAVQENEKARQLNITAVAPVAAAVDLVDTGIRGALTGESRFGSLYIAWIAETYSRDFGLDLRDILREPWLTRVSTLFDGKHSGDAIVDSLPSDPKEMLTQSIVRAFEEDQPHAFKDLLRENQLLGWKPMKPVCVFYGEADVDVTPAQAHLLKAMSPDQVAVVSLGDLEHDPSIGEAVPKIRAWFDGSDPGNCPQY